MLHPYSSDGHYFLTADPDASATTAQWASSLINLGATAFHYRSISDRRLIVTLSVPQRDLAAVLLATGHILAKNALRCPPPSAVLRELQPGTPVRFVTNTKVQTATYRGLDDDRQAPRAHIGGSHWQVDRIRALSVLESSDLNDREMLRPVPGLLADVPELSNSWDAHLASPVQDLSIIGTKSRLERDLDRFIGRTGSPEPPTPLRTLVLPNSDALPTWFTRVLSSQEAEEDLPESHKDSTTILDGNAAIQLLAGVQSDVVFCILDRSIEEEGAADIIIQQRARSRPLSLKTLAWQPPGGVEALAFTGAKWRT